MRRFARSLGAGMLVGLTFLLTLAAATNEVLSGWIVYYIAALAYGSIACLYYGFGEFDE